MAKSMRSKREKRLRAIRREIVEPLYEKKEAAKLAAQEAALAAPKLPVRHHSNATTAMELTATTSSATNTNMDVEMDEDNQYTGSLKPVGKIGKKLRKKFKMGKGKRHGKGKIRRKHI
ncbi:uncharacterized protein LOC132303355 [Cornus florida]|uniref:uncharacterized protein LOC132303355 n=1 Tax=Cornus florida TaxID=4283 RepID=UPI0028A09014|nr:uncharacterized protein LOC132303355 [Cornus florida]